MNIKTGKGQTYKNIALNIMAFAVQFAISFFVSPIVVGKVGATAYGFINLANDMVAYAAILTTVFNSVASRFIANAFYQKEFDRANAYFNSLIVANIGISAVLGLVGSWIIPNVSRLLSVPENLIVDVQITFALVFGSYILSVLTLVFTTSTFVTNRMDLNGVRNVISQLIRLALIIIFLNFINVRIYWVAVASVGSAIALSCMNVGLTKRLTPELKIDLRRANRKYALELAKSGSWMAFTQISNILMRGMDLIIANLFIGSYEMGLLSIARTMPNQITAIISTIAPVFTPVFIMCYTQKKQGELIANVKSSINTMASIFFVLIAGYIVYSKEFYTLWQSSLSPQEITTITILSTVTIIQAFFNVVTSTLAQLSLVTNKLKLPVIVSFGCGVLNIIAVFILLKTTNLGVYAIVLSSTIIMTLRYVLFNSIYAAHVLDCKLTTFMWPTYQTWLSIPLLFIVMIFIKKLLPVTSWGSLMISVLVSAIVGYSMMLLFFGKDILRKFISKIKH